MYQVQHSRPPGVLDALARIYRVEGLRASYHQIQWHANMIKVGVQVLGDAAVNLFCCCCCCLKEKEMHFNSVAKSIAV